MTMNKPKKLLQGSASNPEIRYITETSICPSLRLGIPIQRTSFQLEIGRLDVDYYYDKGYEITLTLLDGQSLNIHVDNKVRSLGSNIGPVEPYLTDLPELWSIITQGVVDQTAFLKQKEEEKHDQSI